MYENYPFPANYVPKPLNFGSTPFSTQRQEIIRVHGKNGAEAYPMQPNSEILLLDDSQPVVWHKKTDGAGYAILNGYSISALKSENEIAENRYNEIEKRLASLEEKINAKPDYTEFTDDEYSSSDKNSTKRK